MDKTLTLTSTLIQGGLLKKLKMPQYVYQAFFGNTFLSRTDTIIFDEVLEDYRQLARFVMPNVVSRVNQTKNFDVKAFRPAYVKEKDVIEAWSSELQHRMAGEDVGGQYTPSQRAQMIRAKQLRMHRIKINNRFEVMAHQALAHGKVIIKGEEYPEVEVDFGRDDSLTMSTAGTMNWADPTTDPLQVLQVMSDLTHDIGQAEVDTLIMGRKAWANFYKWFSHKDRIHLLDRNIRGSDLLLNLLNVGEVRGFGKVGQFTSLNGVMFEVYLDTRTYVNEMGEVVPYVADDEVIGIDTNSHQGVFAFGAIKDVQAGLQATRIFHKEFTTDEPSATFLLSQSAPLPINLNPNATFRILNVNE